MHQPKIPSAHRLAEAQNAFHDDHRLQARQNAFALPLSTLAKAVRSSADTAAPSRSDDQPNATRTILPSAHTVRISPASSRKIEPEEPAITSVQYTR